jgi:hypothetical protein
LSRYRGCLATQGETLLGIKDSEVGHLTRRREHIIRRTSEGNLKMPFYRVSAEDSYGYYKKVEDIILRG